ncbi:pyridoxal phosphate-dependent aminotransferase [bacterium]|nr:MAG: pyridoxal phosphate-dependent aminotransferase [bacterium]
MNISTRGRKIPPSPIRKLVPYAIDAKKRGVSVYHLNIGQPDIETPASFWNAVHSYPARVLAYGNSQGIPEYRQWLAKYYRANNIDVDENEILVTTGGSEAIMFAMLAVADPGDNIIVLEPFYTNYNGYAVMTDIKLNPIATQPEQGYHLPPAEVIESKVDERTKAILICSPNNPTGTVLTGQEIEIIADIAEKHDIFVIADEVYREFIYEGVHTSILHIPKLHQRGIIVDSISKRFSCCGARIGAVVTKNTDIMNSVIKMGQARLCPPTVEQYGAQAVLMQLSEDYFSKMVSEYKNRRDVTYEELMKIPDVVCKKPSGAFYIMAKLPIDDVEEFAKFLLTDFSMDGKTVMIAPGPGFYATSGLGNSEVRIAYVLESEKMRDAIRILAKGIRAFNNR